MGPFSLPSQFASAPWILPTSLIEFTPIVLLFFSPFSRMSFTLSSRPYCHTSRLSRTPGSTCRRRSGNTSRSTRRGCRSRRSGGARMSSWWVPPIFDDASLIEIKVKPFSLGEKIDVSGLLWSLCWWANQRVSSIIRKAQRGVPRESTDLRTKGRRDDYFSELTFPKWCMVTVTTFNTS